MFLGDLKGKTALVTGGGSGISLAFTLRLLEAGCNVVVADLALSPEAQALEKYTTTPKAVFQKTDVTDWAQLDAAFQVALTTFGSLDIVCPGAGLSEPVSFALFHDLSLQISSHRIESLSGLGSFECLKNATASACVLGTWREISVLVFAGWLSSLDMTPRAVKR
jgi:NAD(P)-dependent dehydrogenase (short-subunit alcohol dehydrogenase family)